MVYQLIYFLDPIPTNTNKLCVIGISPILRNKFVNKASEMI